MTQSITRRGSCLFFFIVLLTISAASFKYFEMPMQNYLRGFSIKRALDKQKLLD